MAPKGRAAEEVPAALAFSAYGIVDRAELLGAGLTADEIRQRLEIGALIPQFRGVYRVGHAAPSTDAHYLAAVRACGAEAYLCGLAAGYSYGLRKGEPPPPEVVARTERRANGVLTHRCRGLDPRDVCVFRRIPMVTVPRALVDIAAVLPVEALARACHEAGVRYRVTPRHVEAVLARRPNSPGAGNLRLVMCGEVKVSLSDLERAFLRWLTAHAFPLPETNRVADGRRVDCRWPDYRLTVELDGYRFHNSRYSWEQGLEREREARLRGDRFRRFSYADVFEDRSYMLRELTTLLS